MRISRDPAAVPAAGTHDGSASTHGRNLAHHHAPDVRDIRFPTSLALDGSDAMNPAPDYSAAYVVLTTDAATGSRATASPSPSAAATSCAWPPSEALAPLRASGATSRRSRRTWRRSGRELAGDGQLRWLGPEKGVIHLATAAVVNAVWDLLRQACRASRCGSCSPT